MQYKCMQGQWSRRRHWYLRYQVWKCFPPRYTPHWAMVQLEEFTHIYIISSDVVGWAIGGTWRVHLDFYSLGRSSGWAPGHKIQTMIYDDMMLSIYLLTYTFWEWISFYWRNWNREFIRVTITSLQRHFQSTVTYIQPTEAYLAHSSINVSRLSQLLQLSRLSQLSQLSQLA